jgi:WD40 repeat protein
MSLPRATLATFVAIASFSVWAGAAQASFPGANGNLAGVFSQEDRDSSALRLELFTPAGKRLTEVARCTEDTAGGSGTTGRCPRDPSFSPDGSRMAFASSDRLAVANSNGSGVTLLPQLTGRDADPAWSPNGQRLVFTGRVGGKRNLYTVDPDGSSLSQLTTGGGRAPAWSSRNQIAFVAGGVVWRLRASDRVRLARGDHPDWSPSGRSLAYDLGGHSYRVSARGTGRRLLARRAREPVFSPNGRRLAFLRVRRVDRNIRTSSVFTRAVNGGRSRLVRAGGELPIGSTFRSWADLAWQPRS